MMDIFLIMTIIAICGLLVVEFNFKIRQAVIDKYIDIELMIKDFHNIV